MRVSALRLFGAGGTQGGVKKVSQPFLQYDNWLLCASAREQVSRLHHPLVTEYFLRLEAKRQTVEALQEKCLGDTTALGNRLKNKVDNSPFNLVEWNISYKDELDVAQRLSSALFRLQDNVILQDQLAAKVSAGTFTNGEDTDLLQLAREDISSILGEVESMDAEVTQVMENRLDAEDIVGSSTRIWNVAINGKAGGEEANHFAAELGEMLKVYAEQQRGWQVLLVDERASDGEENDALQPGGQSAKGSVAAAPSCTTFQLRGDQVYRNFRHEIGVHKVQRVPATDHDGKMQTSTAVLTLMPVLDPVSVDVHESDCKIDYVRGSGPGGQGMQSSSNAVCLTHFPSGITVKCHQSRSALRNKELALQMVAQKLLNVRLRDQNNSLHSAWQNQWSSGERSDKMRTYNYPQNRVTDHRLGKDFPLSSFMEGKVVLKTLHESLNAIDDQSQMHQVLLRHIMGDFGSRV